MEVQVLPPDQIIKMKVPEEIIHGLKKIKGESIFMHSIKYGIEIGDSGAVISMIKDQARDNRELIVGLLGEDILNSIEVI